jgi:hypothetical protein
VDKKRKGLIVTLDVQLEKVKPCSIVVEAVWGRISGKDIPTKDKNRLKKLSVEVTQSTLGVADACCVHKLTEITKTNTEETKEF